MNRYQILEGFLLPKRLEVFHEKNESYGLNGTA